MYRFELFPRTARRRPAVACAEHPLTSLHREMTNLFGDRLGRFHESDEASVTFPALNVSEAEGAFRVTAELPGMDLEGVSVTVEENLLVIAGEKTAESEEDGREFHRRERTSGRFRRALTLPKDIDVEAIEASFTQGVLTVTLPRVKEEEAGRKTIEIKTG